jgi:hypothetical protein
VVLAVRSGERGRLLADFRTLARRLADDHRDPPAPAAPGG